MSIASVPSAYICINDLYIFEGVLVKKESIQFKSSSYFPKLKKTISIIILVKIIDISSFLHF